ncbi:MAG TPA: orotidine-5'-phosphate decarboxylase [Saprospiraceae bacterium]|nr:orotidine-5'-phosphate decarboxylase [Saprospiraceae bacterium]
MDKKTLIQNIKVRRSFLCVGLDSDLDKLPPHLDSSPNGVLQFNKEIIDATAQYCVAYKLNTAFYEALGMYGWDVLAKTIEYIPKTHFIIADAKRGDIGNTSTMYAKAFFQSLNADAVTVAPYMGEDSVKPFLAFKDKWTILLALTSNEGSKDFQYIGKDQDIPLYKKVILKSLEWGTDENLMFVLGATRVEQLKEVRSLVPHHFFLIPGVGAQGGSLKEVVTRTITKDIGILVNSSREIIYASNGIDFAERAGMKAKEISLSMAQLMDQLH